MYPRLPVHADVRQPPLTCPPALPALPNAASRRHALANYITDGQPEHYLPFTECLAITGLVYFRWGAAPLQVVAAVSARGRRHRRHRGVPAEARGVAAQVLHLWGAGCVLHADGTLEGRDRMAQHFAAACRLLDRPAAQRECCDQLAALAAAHGLPAFSLPQLRYLLHYFAARRGIEALANLNQQLVAAQLEAGMPSRAAATTAAVEARLRMPLWRRLARETQAEAMAAWQLAPDRPAALNCVHGASVQGIGLPDEMRAVISAQTIELARTQRSDRWLCQACHDRFGTVVFSASAMLEPTERPLLQAKAQQVRSACSWCAFSAQNSRDRPSLSSTNLCSRTFGQLLGLLSVSAGKAADGMSIAVSPLLLTRCCVPPALLHGLLAGRGVARRGC